MKKRTNLRMGRLCMWENIRAWDGYYCGKWKLIIIKLNKISDFKPIKIKN